MPSDGYPSFYHLWVVMDFHPNLLVMDIHAPSRLLTKNKITEKKWLLSGTFWKKTVPLFKS